MQGTLQAGDQIGNWVVVGLLGAGGMGEVYRCHSTLTDRVTSAVKVMNGSVSAAAKRRFVREIEVLSSLQHPAIVRVLGGGSDPERDTLFMVMELVEGSDLSTFVTGRRLARQEALRVIRDAALGLAAVHEAGVFHRDIKPANLMLGPKGQVTLIDFGVALSQGQTRLTRRRAVPGTLAYMPPEVFSQGSHDPAQGDLYSLGVCLYEALTGLRGFSEDPQLSDIQRFAAVMGLKIRCECLDPGPSFADPLRDLVRRCTARDPSERHRGMPHFAEDLTALLAGQPTTEWVSPEPQVAQRTDDTFTLDAEPTALLPAQAPSAAPEALASFPYFSLALASLAGLLPPGWGLFWAAVAVVIPPLGGGVWLLSVIAAPVVLPLFAIVGFLGCFWLAIGVRKSSGTPGVWYVWVLFLVMMNTLHLAMAVADSALMIKLVDQVLDEQRSGRRR